MSSEQIKRLFEKISPFIERHTQMTCPFCANVCCIDRHGTPEEDDLRFFKALGIPPPDIPAKYTDTEPCRYLGNKGCRIMRFERPFKCTWYFCPPLLESMYKDNKRDYRKFIETFNELLGLRRNFIN